MIAQIVLVLAFGLVIAFALMQQQYSRFVSRLIALLALAGIVFSATPNLSTVIANYFGVTRGVDLAMYFYVPISIFLILHLNAKIRQQHQSVTELVRRFALFEERSKR